MGMAASQARFLSLTARKSNVEYQGQQINQERTALANESSNLYSELTQLEVPTPPSTSDYYKTVYTFNATEISGESTAYTLENIYSTPDGDYATLSSTESYFASVSTIITGTVAASETEADEDSDLLSSGYTINIGGSSYEIYLDSASTYATTLSYLQDANSNFATVTNDDGNSYLAYYEVNGTKYYLSAEQLSAGTEVNSATSVQQLSKTVTQDYAISSYETNDTGRTTSISVITGTDDDGNDVSTTYELTCTSVEDEEAYEQAMLDYEYYQSLYEKEVSDLNAKTEAIQQKDKTLELELKQLDTDQDAISTEMDAVQKVIEDNVESTFNTFG
ncbi:MAG: hypothetical protein LUE64_06715 [Candidatus Gastranaerophilales bacterium]|nr:hypothetical protein [Candidatus Gastranaerophilales bacterium]